jgi:hypothetical protein
VTTGETDFTSGSFTELDSAVTEAILSVELRIWVPLEEPDLEPLNTVSVFEPKLWMDFSIDWELPVPIARSTITDATPMRTPSIVRNVRSQFEPIPRTAMKKFPKIADISPAL